MKHYLLFGLFFFISVLFSCKDEGGKDPDPIQKLFYTPDQFCMGADLSYVYQILDFGGTYRDSGVVKDPYLIFRNNGANVVRFRLFHTPAWTKEIYGTEGVQMYNDYHDVKLGIERAKNAGFQTCLDFHYSDNWADPGTTGYFDNYNNIINPDKLLSDYPATEEGQFNYLVKLTQEIIDGGGKGIFPWEPAWISSNMKTQWGQGSAWECNTLFDFQGNVIKGMYFMTFNYQF